MLDDQVLQLARGKNFAAFTTLFRDGRPQTQVMWVDADDEHILINTEIGRAKYRNVLNDPRVTVTIIDASNPYHYAEVRGQVVDRLVGPQARSHLDEVSRKYTGTDYQHAIGSDRVILKIRPEQAQVH